MEALNYYMVLERIPQPPVVTKTGIEVSENNNPDIRYHKGKLLSVGSKIEGLSEGDEIWYDKHAGHDHNFKGKVYRVITINDAAILD